jgi:hypothetical protein
MPRTLPTALLALTAGLMLAAPAPAQMVVQYNFDNTTATSMTAPPSSMNVNVTANSTVNGTNVVQDYSLPDYGQQVLRAAITNTATPDEASAVSGDSYWGFTVTPNAGFKMNFTNFTFDGARGGAGTPRTWYLYSSTAGFTTGNAIAFMDVPTVRPILTAFTVDLSGAPFQGLTGPVEFRMYLSTPGTGQSLEFDNVTVNGTVVAVPEPACTLALAAGAGGLWMLRRQRIKKSAQVSAPPTSRV